MPALGVFLALVALVGISRASEASENLINQLATECPPDCPELCPPTLGCSDTRLDACGCCQICLRQVNETCGPQLGACADGLYCRTKAGDEVQGRCTSKWPEPCLKAKCDVLFTPKCPDDSRLEVIKSDEDECCPKKGTCVCDAEKCAAKSAACLHGYERVMIQEGTGEPGNCCDEYECREPPIDCTAVDCDDSMDELPEECPGDSFRPLSYIPDGACCPIQPACRCKPGLCQPVHCPAGQSALISAKGDGSPGTCCDIFTCVAPSSLSKTKTAGTIVHRNLRCFDAHSNQTFAEGATFFRSACETCECRSGIVRCKQMQCPHIGADKCSVGHKEDECCPVCTGCLDDQGGRRNPSEHWAKDECTNCTCNPNTFSVECTVPVCKIDCLEPRRVPGECCPVCDAPTVVQPPVVCPDLRHCPLRCEHGLQKTDWGCFQCKCADGLEPTVASDPNSECVELSEANCDKQCAHGYRRDQKGCPVCKCAKCPPIDTCYKHCLYGFETNSLGCPVCKCRGKSRIDARLQVSEKEVLATSNVCTSVVDGDRIVSRDEGEWWTDGNCRQCFCQHRTEYCSLISCPPRPTECPLADWHVAKGECCPSCAADVIIASNGTVPATAVSQHGQTVCHSPGDGRLYVDGETWNLADCVSCTCRVGHVLCSATQCPPVPCDEPLKAEGDSCCATCPPELTLTSFNETSAGFCTDDHGIARANGEQWRLNECTSCRCSASSPDPLCFSEKCPYSAEDCEGKPLMIKGRCCPVCSDELRAESICTYENHTYTLHEEFWPNECRNCTCHAGGRLDCVELQCPPCEHFIVRIAGECCGMCVREHTTSGAEYRNPGGDEHVAKPVADGYRGLILGLFMLVSVLGFATAAIGIVYIAIRRRNKLAAKQPHMGAIPHTKDPLAAKHRVPSESESANMSLLSNHSDSSTAPSSNSSDHGQHSETSPLTPDLV
uniref:Cysteine-rich motor neuron 1 protein n=1 Tax=Panagrellus redivivus TaxID=6233 RepID=A0A7E4UPE0_PANRE